MKIKETIERECCTHKDLKEYKGIKNKNLIGRSLFFCIYCGQAWLEVRKMGPAGNMEDNLEKICLNDDKISEKGAIGGWR